MDNLCQTVEDLYKTIQTNNPVEIDRAISLFRSQFGLNDYPDVWKLIDDLISSHQSYIKDLTKLNNRYAFVLQSSLNLHKSKQKNEVIEQNDMDEYLTEYDQDKKINVDSIDRSESDTASEQAKEITSLLDRDGKGISQSTKINDCIASFLNDRPHGDCVHSYVFNSRTLEMECEKCHDMMTLPHTQQFEQNNKQCMIYFGTDGLERHSKCDEQILYDVEAGYKYCSKCDEYCQAIQ